MKKKNKNLIKEIALERMYRLMDLAIEEWKKHSERSLDYLKLMKKIGSRNKVRIPIELKELYCKKCMSLLLEGKDKEIRVKNKKILIKCKKCGKIKEIKGKQKKEKIVLGITGRIGTGKTTVLNELKKKGFKTLNADKIAKKELEKKREKIKEKFGQEVVEKKGVQHKKLAKLVFNNKKKLKELNELIHPLVRKKIEEELKGRKFVAVEIPLLFETRMQNLCDKVLVVTAKKEKIIQRNKKMNKKEIEKRMKNQMNSKEKKRKADFVLENNGNLKELQEKINELIKKIENELK